MPREDPGKLPPNSLLETSGFWGSGQQQVGLRRPTQACAAAEWASAFAVSIAEAVRIISDQHP
jgi:hypothetical protein